jgi:hypothetical protein
VGGWGAVAVWSAATAREIRQHPDLFGSWPKARSIQFEYALGIRGSSSNEL